jgi:hypothetical protein
LYKNHPKLPLSLPITVFSVRMRFSSVQKARLARGARNGRSATLADETGYFELQRQNLRGRRPVRADRRLRTDEKRVRTQSAILTKRPRAYLGLSITVFSVRMRFSSVRKTRLARAARNDRSVILDEKSPKPSLNAKWGGLGAAHG